MGGSGAAAGLMSAIKSSLDDCRPLAIAMYGG